MSTVGTGKKIPLSVEGLLVTCVVVALVAMPLLLQSKTEVGFEEATGVNLSEVWLQVGFFAVACALLVSALEAMKLYSALRSRNYRLSVVYAIFTAGLVIGAYLCITKTYGTLQILHGIGADL